MNRLRLEFATAGFLSEMRRQWAVLNPGTECPVKKSLGDYPSEQRSALMAALEKTITFADPASDKLFDAWRKRREEQQQAV